MVPCPPRDTAISAGLTAPRTCALYVPPLARLLHLACISLLTYTCAWCVDVGQGLKFGMDIRGTHAHAFVSSFSSISDLPTRMLRTAEGHEVLANLLQFHSISELSVR